MPPEGADSTPGNQPPADSPLAWLRYAQAELALASAPLPPGAVRESLCFHAQQAAEKALKAVLIACGVPFPFTHNLRRLVDLLPAHITPDQAILVCDQLTVYAAATRYPLDEPPVTDLEYREAVSIAAAVVSWAERQLGQRLAD
jgi:HEPN domain-containing protein